MLRKLLGICLAVGLLAPHAQASYAFKQSIDLVRSKIPNTSPANFPVLVSVTDAKLASVGNGGHVASANGFDINFYSDSALTTPLSCEKDTYNATTGAINYWVNVNAPNNSTSGSNTVIYIAYGDGAIGTLQCNSTATWSSAYRAVYHYGDGSTLSLSDSTANANTLTASTSSPTATTGQMGGGALFTRASTQFFTRTLASASTLPMTMSAWVKYNTNDLFMDIVHNHSAASNGIKFGKGSNAMGYDNHPLLTFAGVADYIMTTLTAPSTGTWYYTQVTVSGDTGTGIYYVCAAGTRTSESQSVGTHTGTLTQINIGSKHDGTSDLLDGVEDETRMIDNIFANPDDRFVTECNNQTSPSTFLTFGSEVFAGGRLTTLGAGN